jgi:peptidoglycan/LPS O-acetylase OafA/YrhL
MSSEHDAASPAERTDPDLGIARDTGRVIAIDIIRGLAILWVMTYHLFADMTLKSLAGPAGLYPAFGHQVTHLRVLPAIAAFGELVLGQGYMGVALFMMLSGLSLTMNAYRRPEPGLLHGYAMRFRRIIVAYWGGVLILVSVVAVVALFQMLLDGGSYAHQWFNVRIAVLSPVLIHWEDVLWALSVVPWVFRAKPATIPVGSLWFVELLLQYYLIFPFALMLLKKIGPWNLMALGLVVNIIARAAFIYAGSAAMDNLYVSRSLESFAVFRGAEFLIGMSLGYLIVHRREAMREWVGTPFDIAGLCVIAALCLWGGTVLAPKADMFRVLGDLMVQVGLAILILPLLFKRPGRLEASVLAKALTFLGVISFMALVVDDGMRYFGSFLRYEGAHGPGWWFFLWVVYIPGGALIAYPLSAFFGLLPKKASAAPSAAAAPQAAELGLASSG